MRQQEVFNKIGVILKELNDQYKYLEANPDDMNSLELELFVANAHFLADHAEILNKINIQLSTAKPALPPHKEQPKTEEKFFEPVVRQPLKTQSPAVEKTAEQPAITFEIPPAANNQPPANQEPELIRHELDVAEIEDWGDEEEAEISTNEPTVTTEGVTDDFLPDEEQKVVDVPAEVIEPVEETPPAPAKTVEVPKPKDEAVNKEEVLTINQRMSARLNKGGETDQHPSQPINDLKHAISLNDKLLYIKDLFNGYNLAYSEAIEILNRLSSFEDAERFLTKNYVAKNNWESKADTVAKFYSVLKRRYL